jgi:hypothetical protein
MNRTGLKFEIKRETWHLYVLIYYDHTIKQRRKYMLEHNGGFITNNIRGHTNIKNNVW